MKAKGGEGEGKEGRPCPSPVLRPSFGRPAVSGGRPAAFRPTDVVDAVFRRTPLMTP